MRVGSGGVGVVGSPESESEYGSCSNIYYMAICGKYIFLRTISNKCTLYIYIYKKIS